MTYNKPTIEVLGEAVSVIQGTKKSVNTDGTQTTQPSPPNPPDYELDE